MKVYAALVCAAALLCACDREERRLQKPAVPGGQSAASPRVGEVVPGQAGEGLKEVAAAKSYDEGNAFEMSEGKRLYRWYNCSGCHAGGGGGMGPALMDDRWFYGHEPAQIFASVMEGRPNGMPSFRGRIPEDQAWQIVAYVRSMSALTSKIAAPSRSDSLSAGKPETQRETVLPRDEPPAPPRK
jgi:cytochrome c oxidase cbb3-type subunit 3